MRERDSRDPVDEHVEVVLGGGRVPVGRPVSGALKERDCEDCADDVVIVGAFVLTLDLAEESVRAAKGRRDSNSIRRRLESWRVLRAWALILCLVLKERLCAEGPAAEFSEETVVAEESFAAEPEEAVVAEERVEV